MLLSLHPMRHSRFHYYDCHYTSLNIFSLFFFLLSTLFNFIFIKFRIVPATTTSVHPQQGAESATATASTSQEGGIFGDATPSPSETISIDDPPVDPDFSQDTGTGGEEVRPYVWMCIKQNLANV